MSKGEAKPLTPHPPQPKGSDGGRLGSEENIEVNEFKEVQYLFDFYD